MCLKKCGLRMCPASLKHNGTCSASFVRGFFVSVIHVSSTGLATSPVALHHTTLLCVADARAQIDPHFICVLLLPQVLYIGNNKISDWGELDKLASLPALREVLLMGG